MGAIFPLQMLVGQPAGQHGGDDERKECVQPDETDQKDDCRQADREDREGPERLEGDGIGESGEQDGERHGGAVVRQKWAREASGGSSGRSVLSAWCLVRFPKLRVFADQH